MPDGDDLIGEMFTDRYPGSKTIVRAVATKEEKPMTIQAHYEKQVWGQPTIKTIRGVRTELYSAGCFARALGRSLVTIRSWERQGRIPKAPYALASTTAGPRGESVKRRYYTEASIVSALNAFSDAGLLDVRRIDWDSPEAIGVTARITLEWGNEIAAFNES